MPKPREITLVKFTADNLAKVHPTHRNFVIASCRACNQLSYWKTYSIFEHTDGGLEDPEISFVLNRVTNLIWIAISTIIEYNHLARKYLGVIKTEFPALSVKLRTRFAPIAKEISRYPIANRVRNKSVFHFDMEDYTDALKSFPKEHEFKFLYGKKISEAVYPFADDIVFRNHDLSDKAEASELWKLSLNTASDILEFHTTFMLEIFQQYGLLTNNQILLSREDTVGDVRVTKIPVFVDVESVEKKFLEQKK